MKRWRNSRAWRLAYKELVATDELVPGPEMAALLEQFAQEVFQKRFEDLRYEEVSKLRDMLLSKKDEQPVYEIE